jgi:hypothetical protein
VQTAAKKMLTLNELPKMSNQRHQTFKKMLVLPLYHVLRGTKYCRRGHRTQREAVKPETTKHHFIVELLMKLAATD